MKDTIKSETQALHLLLLALFARSAGKELGLDEGYHTTLRDDNVAEELVQSETKGIILAREATEI